MNKIALIVIIFLLSLPFITSLKAQNQLLIPYREKKLWGYCDTTGKIVIKPVYDSVGIFSKENFLKSPMAYVFTKKKMGVIKADGQFFMLPKLDSVAFRYGNEWENAILIRNDGKFGILDYKLKTIVPLIYDQLNLYNMYDSDAYFSVHKGHSYLGRIGKQYYKIEPDGKRSIVSKEAFNQNYTDDPGNEIVLMAPETRKKHFDVSLIKFDAFMAANKDKIDSISHLQFQNNSGYFLLYKDNKTGFISYNDLISGNGKMVLPSYDKVRDAYYSYDFDDRVETYYSHSYSEKVICFLVENDGYLSIVDTDGKLLMPFKYKEFTYWNNYYVGTKENGKVGFYDIKTKTDITPKYEYIDDEWYDYPIWKVKKNGRFGYINKNQLEYFKD